MQLRKLKMRERLSQLLVENGKNNPLFQVLTGDHGYALFDEFRSVCSNQFINVGIAEQSMVGIAAGLAKMGFRPVVYGLAAFVPMRVLEFIKMDVCYNNLPVIFLGDGAGLVYSTLGSSHQCGEDIAVLRVLPNIKIYSPADKFELDLCFNLAMEDKLNASYIRLGKSDRPLIHSQTINKTKSLIKIHTEASSKAFIATGSMVATALEIARANGWNCFSAPCISDFAETGLASQLQGINSVVTLEEHFEDGGLGSNIAELILKENIQISLKRIGLKRKFTSISGSYENAIAEHNLTKDQIASELGLK